MIDLDCVLKDVNALRTEWELPPLSELPRGETGLGWTRCALGEAFDNIEDLASHSIYRSDTLKEFESLFESGLLPEVTNYSVPTWEQARSRSLRQLGRERVRQHEQRYGRASELARELIEL